jgi:hypothetical protein
MRSKILLMVAGLLGNLICGAQNVGIGNPTPTEKLHIDSGSIKIGKLVWSGVNIPFLKFGDGNFITIGEEEADDKLTIRAKEIYFKPSGSYSSMPITFTGTNHLSHFFFGPNEDTYIRGGKNGSNVNICDVGGGRVGIGMASPNRAMLEQNGSVGATAAIFGGDGSGISLQKNWPAIGFNSYLDGTGHKSIGVGYGAQMGLNQLNGSLYLVSFPFNALPNTTFASFVQRFYLSRFGSIGLGTDDPQSDIQIVQKNATENDGIKFIMANPQFGTCGPPGSRNFGLSFYTQSTFATCSGNLTFWDDGFISSAIDAGNGNYYQPSDINKKKNLNYLSNDQVLPKIMLLKPVSYLMKNSKNDIPEFGFISQEVEKVFDGFTLDSKETGVKLLCYTKFIPILTKGIQEQQQQIETLQKENADLKARLEKLEKIITNK